MRANVFRVPMSAPNDISGIERLIDEGRFDPNDVISIMGKTEGNGNVNDFTRGYATLAISLLFSRLLDLSVEEAGQRVSSIMSGGTEGVMSPHFTIFVREDEGSGDGRSPRLAIGATRTRKFKPEEMGRMAQVLETARAVREAMEQAQIAGPEDVHFVQIKCPLLTTQRIEDAESRGHDVVTHDTYKSMGYSRAASALGVALALGEVEESQLSDDKIVAETSLYSAVASTSAGVELLDNEVLVMGNSTAWAGDLMIGHDVMQDAIDAAAVRRALRSAGLSFDCELNDEQRERVVNVFAKCEADPSGEVRGRRHVMLDDSDINQTRHARAVVNAVAASVVGDTMLYISGGSEHQGPPGGGPVAAIVRVSEQ